MSVCSWNDFWGVVGCLTWPPHVWQAGSAAVIIVSSPRIRPPSVIFVIMVVTVVTVMKNEIVVRNLRIVAL